VHPLREEREKLYLLGPSGVGSVFGVELLMVGLDVFDLGGWGQAPTISAGPSRCDTSGMLRSISRAPTPEKRGRSYTS